MTADEINTGHGHVYPRPDGVRARCGGPGICAECSNEKVRRDAIEGKTASKEKLSAALAEWDRWKRGANWNPCGFDDVLTLRAKAMESIINAARELLNERTGPAEPDNDMVICPTCTSQFKAIPVNVQAELSRLEELAHVSGLWECGKCRCGIISQTMYVVSGTIQSNNKAQDCPNGCGPMSRVTERQLRKSIGEHAFSAKETKQ